MRDLAELHKKALAISESKECCDNCYYGGYDAVFCMCPFSDGIMEDINMDPCYEGALIHFAQQDILNGVKEVIRNGRPQ